MWLLFFSVSPVDTAGTVKMNLLSVIVFLALVSGVHSLDVDKKSFARDSGSACYFISNLFNVLNSMCSMNEKHSQWICCVFFCVVSNAFFVCCCIGIFFKYPVFYS